jgi:flagellar motility protein MotE (MotC chaperone)
MKEDDAGKTKSKDPEPVVPSSKKMGMLPIALGVGVFVICVVIFSVKFGVFGSGNVVPTEAGQQEEIADKEAKASDEYVPESHSNLLFADDDEGFDFGDSSAMSVEDSLKQMAWYEQQKKEIKDERVQLDQDRTTLQQLRDETDALLKRRKAYEDGNIAAMAKLYENMNAEEVVPILSNLSDAQVSLIISKMKKRQASEVMGKLSPERAAKITQWLISLETN